MELELVEKAWKVDVSKLDEYYLWASKSTRADTKAQAKEKLLDAYKEAKLKDTLEPVTKDNLPVIREPRLDLVRSQGTQTFRHLFEQVVSRYQEINRLTALLDENPNTYVYITRNNSFCGQNPYHLTDSVLEASIFSLESAINIIKNYNACNSSLYGEMRVEVIDKENHNRMVQKTIDDLKNKFLQ